MSKRRHLWSLLGASLAIAAVAVLFLALAATNSADPAPAGTSPAVTLESIPGSTVKRVILTAKAAERLDIQTGRVSDQIVVGTQMVGGVVIPPPGSLPQANNDGPDGSAPRSQAVIPPTATSPSAGDDVWVGVTLSAGEWARLAKDMPARLLPLAVGDEPGREITAQPAGRSPVDDGGSSMLTIYFVVPGKNSGLRVGDRLRVELQLPGSGDKHKVVPYDALYYDSTGAAWVYVNTDPLVFQRQRIVVERITGDHAVLSDGPPVGTPVVIVGAPLLYGAEIYEK